MLQACFAPFLISTGQGCGSNIRCSPSKKGRELHLPLGAVATEWLVVVILNSSYAHSSGVSGVENRSKAS